MATLSNQKHYTIEELGKLLAATEPHELGSDMIQAIEHCHQFLKQKIAKPGAVFYGINTGFGSLCDTVIDSNELEQLQINLLRSHACGTGDRVPNEVVRAMLLLKVLGLSKGYSGVQKETVQRLLDFFNQYIYPVVYEQGSLGASGDLAPLAHLCLPLLGEGEVEQNGKVQSTNELYKPIILGPKEGLALINGTQFMSGYGTIILLKAAKLIEAATAISALSAEAFACRYDAFDSLVHAIRPHNGQMHEAKQFLKWIEGSPFAAETKTQVQDPYSFRCIPQVHGATRGAVAHVLSVFETEVNAVSDNPNIFADEDRIISGGNFHGQPLALALDYLKIALHELGNISERRTYQLVSGQRGLPSFLAPKAGVNSGFMIPQYTAASIVSKNKQLCTPASADSIVSSNGQEDHVSMGANAAVQAYEVVNNLQQILAIELMTAAQAFEFRRPKKTSEKLEHIYHTFRKEIPYIEHDTYMHPLLISSNNFITNFNFE
ncbi:MAG: histidine ammonia-lyase [Bacteroidota bacterium]|nr:histidine ammonia-lyase [Bacteroidota bacterium]